MCIIYQGRENASGVGYHNKAKNTKVNLNKQRSSQWVPPIMYLILIKWLWNRHVGELKKNTMGMGVCKIIKQMGKINLMN